MATQETRARISTEINTTFPDNTQKLITAEDVRKFMEIINCSKFNLADDNLGSLSTNVNIGNNSLNISQAISLIKPPLFFISFKNDGFSNNNNPNALVSSNIPGVSVTTSLVGTQSNPGPNDDNASEYILVNFNYSNVLNLTGKNVFSADLNVTGFQFLSIGFNDADHFRSGYSFVQLTNTSASLVIPIGDVNSGNNTITATFYGQPNLYLIDL